MDWWINAETFHASAFANDWGQNGHFDWGTLAQSKFTFTTHCPIDKNLSLDVIKWAFVAFLT